MPACDTCTGSRYLLDDPQLGPCTCVTPDAMRELDRRLADAAAAMAVYAERLSDGPPYRFYDMHLRTMARALGLQIREG